MKAMVIGGGIGGLTTAIALRRVGVEAEVFERAPELRELGAGLGLYTNALKALKRLGLRGGVLEAGERLRPSGQFRSWCGDVLLENTHPDLLRNACLAASGGGDVAEALRRDGALPGAHGLASLAA